MAFPDFDVRSTSSGPVSTRPKIVGMEHAPQQALGAIIRAQRELASLQMRQLAEAVGISNPYLSQIERGLREPSETVLNAIAESLATTADELYARAGFIQTKGRTPSESASLAIAIKGAKELTAAQRKALLEIYEGFLDANLVRRDRNDDATAS